MKRRGLTLVEILVALVMVGLITTALTRAYMFGVSFPAHAEQARQQHLQRQEFETRIAGMLQRAVLSEDWSDPSYFFLAGTDASGEIDRVTFTATADKVPQYALNSTDDFETLNELYGTLVGTTEFSIGTTPIGDGAATTGLFIREQRPADGDPDQGGYETVLEAPLMGIEYEFFDGLSWQTTWDTSTGAGRLPSAVRVTYQFEGDAEMRSFVVRIPNSDVTPDNPYDPNEVQPEGGQE